MMSKRSKKTEVAQRPGPDYGDLLAGISDLLEQTAMMTEGQIEFHSPLERLLDRADLRALQWINIARPVVRFETL
jgi:hypothetical protein